MQVSILCRLVILFTGLLLLSTPSIAESANDGLAEAGEHLFRQKCSGCHGHGTGDRPTGPDLAGVMERRSKDWVRNFISGPAEMAASGDEIAKQLFADYHLPMPAFQLSEVEFESLVAFLSQGMAPVAQADELESGSLPGGDAKRGSKLFTGEIRMTNGGAPCLACHGIAGVGLAGVASYGPDLSGLHENFGAEGVAEVLSSLAFPSMEPIYATRPLTESEQADLGAFFGRISGMSVVGDRLLPVEVVGGVLGLLGVFLLFGWGRLRSVRRSLVNRGPQGKGEMR